MRYIGIDYGEARTGIAISDEEGNFAFPREVRETRGNDALLKFIQHLAQRENVNEIILGLPSKMEGRGSAIRDEILVLGKQLDAQGFQIHFENEMFTTRIAESASSKNADAAAAAIILQSFLDKRNRVK